MTPHFPSRPPSNSSPNLPGLTGKVFLKRAPFSVQVPSTLLSQNAYSTPTPGPHLVSPHVEMPLALHWLVLGKPINTCILGAVLGPSFSLNSVPKCQQISSASASPHSLTGHFSACAPPLQYRAPLPFGRLQETPDRPAVLPLHLCHLPSPWHVTLMLRSLRWIHCPSRQTQNGKYGLQGPPWPSPFPLLCPVWPLPFPRQTSCKPTVFTPLGLRHCSRGALEVFHPA